MEYLEKHHTPEATATVDDCLKLAVNALSEIVQSGAQNIEIACMTREEGRPGGVSAFLCVE